MSNGIMFLKVVFILKRIILVAGLLFHYFPQAVLKMLDRRLLVYVAFVSPSNVLLLNFVILYC